MTMIIHKDNLPDIDLDTSSFIYDDIYILIQDEYMCDVLKCMSVPEINDDQFHVLCYSRCFIDYPEVLECYALKSARNAYYYARKVLKGRFELGEPVISNSARFSFRYTRDVLKGRFELGESALATDAEYGYWYARHVLEGRFELGEQIIATDAEYSYHYALLVIRGRFELGEHVILNSEYAVEYRDKFLCQ